MKSTDLLLDDHRHLILASNILAEMAAGAESGQTVNETDLEGLLRFLEEFGDRHHQGIEECVLFPALLQDSAQKNYQRLCGLIFEHERQRSLIEGLHDTVFTKNRNDFIYYARRLNEVILEHVRDEDETVFPLVASTLSAADDERVALEMKAYDKAWQARELLGHLQRLSDLVSKYLAIRPDDFHAKRPGTPPEHLAS